MDVFAKSITPVGRVVLAVGPLALLLAAVSGWREFSVLGIGAVIALAVGMLSIARPQPVGVSRTLVPQKVTVGESSTGVISVRNATRRRVGPRNAEDVLGDRIVQLAIPALKPGETIEEHYVVPAQRRGLFDVGPVRLTRSDSLGLFKRMQGQGTIEQLWVRPRVHPLRSISAGWAKDIDGPTSDTSPRGSAAFHALREYQFGDDLRHVHWRTSARRGSLMVRHFVDTRRTQEVVLLDPRAEFYTDHSFEEAVEIAASVCASAEAAGRSVTLALPMQTDGAQDNRQNFLDRLALVGRSTATTAREVMSIGGHLASNASAFVIVTGDSEPQELVDLARRALRSGLIIIVRVVNDVEPMASGVRGGRVLTTPSAARLPGIWAEAVARS
jgi:uncharacterized protein (DUF58 family)